MLLDGGCDRVLVVVGAAADEVAALLDEEAWSCRDRVDVVPCPGWASGMAASLRAGLEAVTADVAVVHLVDLPDVGAPVVRRVLDRGGRGRGTLARATYAGRPGHPVLVGRDHVPGLLATLVGDHGGRDHLERHAALRVECGDLATGDDADLPETSTP